MSNDLVWLITRKYHSKLVKKNGVVFSAEAGNPTNKLAFKYSGFNSKNVDVAATEKGVKLTLSKEKAVKTPVKSKNGTIIKKQRAVKSVSNSIHAYRPDLQKFATLRALKIVQSQGTPKPLKQKKLRGKKALKA
ncbi:hypothetical protein HK096_001963 [Nowakowskiella sp. JEL0078]|nr:hypothetical protein HK096_001963 [Nowakowskiella sp. JEL0078]